MMALMALTLVSSGSGAHLTSYLFTAASHSVMNSLSWSSDVALFSGDATCA